MIKLLNRGSNSINIKNKRFGKLKVIKLLPQQTINKSNIWLCKCDCGNMCEVSIPNLTRKDRSTKSCGCLHHPNLINQKFGKLKVIKKINKRDKNGHIQWLCKCDCGKTCKKTTGILKIGHAKSCGCLRERSGVDHCSWSGCGEISGSYWASIKSRKLRHGGKFNITKKYIWNLFLKQNRLCAISGVKLDFEKNRKQTASLDRINSLKGYVKGNVQWVHKDINFMKQEMRDEEFIKWCKLVAKNAKI